MFYTKRNKEEKQNNCLRNRPELTIEEKIICKKMIDKIVEDKQEILLYEGYLKDIIKRVKDLGTDYKRIINF
jgi:hypothetical protein